MAGYIVKKEEALSPSFGETFKYVDCLIDLSKKVIYVKPPIAVFSSLKTIRASLENVKTS